MKGGKSRPSTHNRFPVTLLAHRVCGMTILQVSKNEFMVFAFLSYNLLL
jgi:hypothetical protein